MKDKELEKARADFKKIMEQYENELKEQSIRLKEWIVQINETHRSFPIKLSSTEIEKIAYALALLIIPNPAQEQRMPELKK